jgi:hypothetical protein
MNTYEVKVIETNEWSVVVQAPSFDEASDIAKQQIADHEHSAELIDGYCETREVTER